jgi:hypothetical protein
MKLKFHRPIKLKVAAELSTEFVGCKFGASSARQQLLHNQISPWEKKYVVIIQNQRNKWIVIFSLSSPASF